MINKLKGIETARRIMLALAEIVRALPNYQSEIDAAQRELREETGVQAFDFQPHPGGWTHVFTGESSWVTLHFVARLSPSSPKARITEPSKCAALEWRYSDEGPTPIFAPLKCFLAAGNDPWGGYPR